MTRAIVAALALAALAGCYSQVEAEQETTNREVTVGLLFEHDGCTVYRFRDGGHARYFVRCDDGSARTEGAEHHGKHNTRPVAIPTAKVRR